MRKYVIGVVIGALFSSMAVALAGYMDPTGPPGNASGQMHTLEQIYDRLESGAATPKMGAFTEPSSGPGSTMHTLNEIMAIAPVTHTNGATATHVLENKMFWGLHSSAWATQTGAMLNNGAVVITPTTISQTIAEGYHDGTGYVEGDTDLAAGNIISGVSIFGIAGDPNVADTSSGDAAASDILNGTKAWVDGSEVTGERYGGCTCTGTLNGTRWCDNGDGTVTDLLGYNGKGKCLVWLQNASWGGVKPWRNASTDCSSPDYTCYDDAHTRASILEAVDSWLSDGSVEGDWRLPTKTELHGLTQGTEQVLSGDQRAFTGVQPGLSGIYWSSTSNSAYPYTAWCVRLSNGYVPVYVHPREKDQYLYVWPVRGGQ